MFKERRMFLRANYNAGVRWISFADSSKRTEVVPDLMINIGAGGLCLIASKVLDKNEELRLKFNLTAGKIMDVRGRIKWIRRINENNESSTNYYAGIEFLDVSSPDKEFIDGFVSNLAVNPF